jgi:hypothetical protein
MVQSDFHGPFGKGWEMTFLKGILHSQATMGFYFPITHFTALLSIAR